MYKNFLTSIYDKNSLQSGHRGSLPQHMKAIHNKLSANIILSGEKNESISSMISNKTSVPTLATIIQHSLGSPSHRSREEKEINEPRWEKR